MPRKCERRKGRNNIPDEEENRDNKRQKTTFQQVGLETQSFQEAGSEINREYGVLPVAVNLDQNGPPQGELGAGGLPVNLGHNGPLLKEHSTLRLGANPSGPPTLDPVKPKTGTGSKIVIFPKNAKNPKKI